MDERWTRNAAVRFGVAVILALAVVGTVSDARAQEEEAKKRVLEPGRWYPMVESGVTLTQSSYSDNWAGGDKGSIVWAAILNAALENQLNPKMNWNNTLKLSYGQTHQQKGAGEERSWDQPEKSTDLIDFETILRLTLGAWVDPYGSFRVESQFQDLSDPLGRDLAFNPVRFRESAGIARKFIDREDRSLLSRLGFTFRQSSRRIFSSDEVDTLTGRPLSRATTTQTSNDGGLEFTNDAKAKILGGRVTWTGKLSAYQPIFYSGKDELDKLTPEQLAAVSLPGDVEDYPLSIDIDFENLFSTQITKLLSVNLYTRWVYDKYDNSVLPVLSPAGELTNPEGLRTGIRKAGQFKQTLSLGLTYRLL